MKLNFTAIGISIFLFFMGMNDVNAFHIVGGEITYKCIGANEYRALLTVYRDCNCGNCGDLDDTAHVFVFRKDGIGAIPIIDSLYKVPRPPKNPVDPPINLCIEDPAILSSVCVEKADYEFELFLPPSAGGYDIVYQRYSRNSTLNNINSPAQTGSTYMTSIPPSTLALCNSSPVFKEFPPTMLCTGIPFSLDQSATDANGDSLVYELCNPIIGGSDSCPTPGLQQQNGSCATIGPPPYSPVSWSNGYDTQNPLGQDVMTLNPTTGRLFGIAPPSGQYVVGICVSEYRDGELINSIRRDFQFNVIECEASVAQVESDDVTANGEYLFNTCNDLTVNFINTSLKANRFEWDFGVPGTNSDTSTEPNPSFQYPDTGRYVGQLIAIYETPDFFCVDTAEIVVLMYPLVDSNFDADVACYYESTTFTNTSTSTYGNFQTFTWDFGDGNTSTDINPVHQYETGGTYLVSLTSVTDLGCRITSEKEIYVVPKVADFSTTLKCPGVPIDFVNETSIGTTAWQWNFGDPSSGADNTSTLEDPSHIYGAIGDYTVTFYTESTEGCKDTTDLSFTIYPEFLVDAGPDIEVCFGDTVPLSVIPSHPTTPYTYIWSPEASLNDINLQNPSFNADYEGPRNYSVEVRDPNGCINSDQVEVMGLPLPEVNAPEDFDLCFDGETTLDGATGNNVANFEWRTNAGLLITDTELIPTVSPDTTTTYVLSAIDN
ncbi:MAG: PKD domain-containing protein, partial [Chitinophagales bacterium]